MKTVGMALIALWTFGIPFYFGFKGLNVVAPIIWAIFACGFAVGTGWRHPNSGLIKSALVGLAFGLLVFVPLYYLGRWFS